MSFERKSFVQTDIGSSLAMDSVFKRNPFLNKKTQEDKQKLSVENMQNMTNEGFLKITLKNRIGYVTKPKTSYDEIIKGRKSTLTISFDLDGNGIVNRDLWLKTTAGQVLPEEVKQVSVKGIVYERKGMKGEFFSKVNKRLIINDGTKIDEIVLFSNDEKTEIKKEIQEKVEKYAENNRQYIEDKDIILEALKRGIEPKFAIVVFGEKLKKFPKGSSEKKVLSENMFTEFDRLRPGINMWNGNILKNNKYPDELVIKILNKFGGKNWKEKAQEYGISENEIKRIKTKNTAKYLNLQTRLDIISGAPENVKKLVKKYFPESEYENALLVCNGESSFNNKAINNNNDKYSSTDRGLFQINNHWHSSKYRGKNIFDPEINVKIAYDIFKEAGKSWKPWYAAKKIGLV